LSFITILLEQEAKKTSKIMVEIEEVPADEPQKKNGSTGDDDSKKPPSEKDADGWEKLMGDDLIMKVIDKSEPAGDKGPEPINPQDSVLIDFVGRVAKDKTVTDGPIFQEVKGWLITVGDGDVLPCLEMAARFLETGQTGRVWAHSKFAFGNGTRSYTVGDQTQQLPPNTSVMFEIKVTMIVMDTSRLNPYFTIQKANTRKLIANDIYQQEWCAAPKSPEDPSCEMAMNRAIRLYTKAAKDMETLLQGTYFSQVEKDHPQRGQSKQLMMDCLNNIVAVHLRQRQYHTAKQASVEVLKQDPKNIKALLRAAKSALLDPASTLEEVEAALKAAEEEITYKNPQQEKELKQIKAQFKKKRHEYKEQSKTMFGNKLQRNNALSSDDADKQEEKQKESTESKGEEPKGMGKPRVSFDESTTKPPSKQGTDESVLVKDDINFWKAQLRSMLIQVVLPLGLYFLYRLVMKANRIAEATLAANEARMPVVDDADTTIDLD